jgi:hypothetical protein
MPNTASLLTISLLTSLMAAWMISKRERLGRMGLAAIAPFLLACMGIYAGAVFILPSFGQIPTLLWLTYCIIPLYFVAVALYWLWSLWATWRNWCLLWSTTNIWAVSGRTGPEAVKHIMQALRLQGCSMPGWVVNFLFSHSQRKARQIATPKS